MDIISYKKSDVIYRDLEDVLIIKNIRCNEMLTLEDVSADIWRFLSDNNNVEIMEIVTAISDDYGISQNEIIDDINAFIYDLYYAGVILINGNYADIDHNEDITRQYINDDFESEIIKIYQEKNLIYFVTFELTYSCNEKCIHCYANYPLSSDRKELTVKQLKETLINLYEMKCMHLTFTGGDPFMFPRFVELFEFARDLGFSCDIFTNALYMAEHNDILQRIIKCRPQAFFISLYGADAQTHETITTVPGSFAKTVFSIQRIREANIPVVLNIMMLKSNAEKIEDIIAFAKTLDVDYRIGISLIFKNDGSNSPMKHFIDDKNTIKKILSFEKERFFSFDQHIGEQKSDFFCGAAETSLAISPNGIVYPCVSLKISLGNILKNSISEIWYSAKRRELKTKLSWNNAIQCKNCNYLEVCPHCIGISLLETGDMFSCNTCDRILAECLYEIDF